MPDQDGRLILTDAVDFTDRQLAFLEAVGSHRFVLYGGAMGGGKSFILRWWLFIFLVGLYQERKIGGVKVGLFCEDYPSLKDRHLDKIKMEFPSSFGRLTKGDTRDFILADKYGGGCIALRNLDDPSKYQSAEFAAIAVDELTKSERKMFDYLRTRLRWPGVDRPVFAGATNPGGKGHGWVKSYWIDGNFPPEMAPLREEFAFIRARAEDNPYLTESYYEELRTLPPDLAKAYAEGDWDLFVGKYFDVFDPTKDVVRPEEIGIEPWWPRWISIDWGFAHNSAVYWHTFDGRVVWTYRELVKNQLTPRELAFQIAERCVMRCPDCGGTGAGCEKCKTTGTVPEKIADIYLSHDAFARKTEEKTAALQMQDVFRERRLPPPTPSDTDRKGGWMLMYQMLRDRTWKIGSNCQALIASIPNLVRDERDIEDVAKVEGDDPADSARYGLKGRFGKVRAPAEQKIAAKMTSEDPTIRAIQALKAQHELKKVRPEGPHSRRRMWSIPSQQR